MIWWMSQSSLPYQRVCSGEHWLRFSVEDVHGGEDMMVTVLSAVPWSPPCLSKAASFVHHVFSLSAQSNEEGRLCLQVTRREAGTL